MSDPHNRSRVPMDPAKIDQTTHLLRNIRTLPPEERKHELEKIAPAMRRFPQIRALLKDAQREIEEATRYACSAPRITGFTRSGEPYGNAGMTWSRGAVRVGDREGTIATQRLTPEIAVDLEDRYDMMTTFEATFCTDPPSITGLQMQQLQAMKGKLERNRIRTKKPAKRKDQE